MSSSPPSQNTINYGDMVAIVFPQTYGSGSIAVVTDIDYNGNLIATMGASISDADPYIITPSPAFNSVPASPTNGQAIWDAGYLMLARAKSIASGENYIQYMSNTSSNEYLNVALLSNETNTRSIWQIFLVPSNTGYVEIYYGNNFNLQDQDEKEYPTFNAPGSGVNSGPINVNVKSPTSQSLMTFVPVTAYVGPAPFGPPGSGNGDNGNNGSGNQGPGFSNPPPTTTRSLSKYLIIGIVGIIILIFVIVAIYFIVK